MHFNPSKYMGTVLNFNVCPTVSNNTVTSQRVNFSYGTIANLNALVLMKQHLCLDDIKIYSGINDLAPQL